MDGNSKSLDLDIFVRVARFASSLFDDELSCVATSIPSNARNRSQFHGVVKACEDLLVSTKGFLDKVKNSPNSAEGGRGQRNELQANTDNENKIFHTTENVQVIIPQRFATLCEQINSKELSCGYYCRACQTLCRNEKQWVKHLGSGVHYLVYRKPCKNIMSSCNKCPVKVIAIKLLARAYIQYHIQVNHPEIQNTEYSNFYKLESLFNSYKRQFEQPSPSRQSASSPTRQSTSSPINTPTEVVDEKPLVDAFNYEKSNIRPYYEPFDGICLVCIIVFYDKRNFMIHQTKHGDQIRSFCITPNLSFCGFDDNIALFLDLAANFDFDKAIERNPST